MAYFFLPNSAYMAEANLSAYSTTPFLLSADFIYLDEANRYLRERAAGRWSQARPNPSAFAALRAPSDNSLTAYGHDLENWLSYLEQRKRDWRDCTLDDVHAYRDDMRSGHWAADHRGLADSTVDRRTSQALDFLNWAVCRGHRPAPDQMSVGPESLSADRGAEIIRKGRRSDPRHLRLPTTQELAVWEQSIELRECVAKTLGCKSVPRTGMRLEEVCLLRACQLPDPLSMTSEKARMEICYGTKGGRQQGDPERRGKSRTLRFATSFLRELVEYRDLVRPIALKRFRELNPRLPLPPELLLSPETGRRISTDSMYKAWHRSPALPFPGFSPHAGRHTFACRELLRLLADEFDLINRSIKDIPLSTVMQHAGNLVDIYLRPALGHVDRTTTERYLGWLADHLYGRNSSRSWAKYLDDADG